MSSPLADKSLLIIFTYSPTGLGHLRVTDALFHGLAKDASEPLLFNSQDASLVFLHRVMSVNPLIRRWAEWAQSGLTEDAMTAIYRFFVRSHTELLYNQMLTLISERYERPTRVLVIASHFGLAHQLAEIKQKLEMKMKIRMILVVQVTDDSPQHIWYVFGADLTFVPSEKTKEQLLQYGEQAKLPWIQIVVNAYPLSPVLNKTLANYEINRRIFQVDHSEKTPIEVIIPISGAAVGTDLFAILTDELHKKSSRFMFHVVCKIAPFTQKFIKEMTKRSYINLVLGTHDQEVVDAYERVYQQTIISLEITKPSEQSFKALLDCTKRSASILLFTEPVGRQEYDNLEFLRRHKLIPDKAELKQLWKLAQNEQLTQTERTQWLRKAALWRGISLSEDPLAAANFIWWCLRNGIFTAMMTCKIKQSEDDPHKQELNSDGVKTFWKMVEALV